MYFCTRSLSRQLTAVVCSMLLVPGGASSTSPRPPEQQAPAAEEQAPKIPNDQLDSLVAPIALYPDPMLAQVLAASTYPLEIVQLRQFLDKHKELKDKALTDAVMKQPWDPSVQGLAALPDVVKRLSDDIQWSTDLGNAFLAQQSDVMDAVQRMRKKAEDKGLKSNEQMKVETQTVENKQVIVIQQANPQVIQVPSYDPVVVYGTPPYPYPPIYYPPPPPSGWAVAGGMALSFGVGVAMGAMWSGGWGYNAGWGGGNNNININNNNTFVNNSNRTNNSNRQNVNAGNRTGNSWQHNPQHRGGAPYSNKATANKFGGTARGDSMATRQANARQNPRQNQGQMGGRQQGGGTDRGDRQQPGASNRAAGGAGGGDRVGNRSVSSGSGAGSRGGGGDAFGGASRGGGGSSARASSSRGSSSMGGSRGGGGRRR